MGCPFSHSRETYPACKPTTVANSDGIPGVDALMHLSPAVPLQHTANGVVCFPREVHLPRVHSAKGTISFDQQSLVSHRALGGKSYLEKVAPPSHLGMPTIWHLSRGLTMSRSETHRVPLSPLHFDHRFLIPVCRQIFEPSLPVRS